MGQLSSPSEPASDPDSATGRRPDPEAGEALRAAVAGGDGLPALLRAAARLLGAGLVLADRDGAVLAVAGRSPGEERELLADRRDGDRRALHVDDESVGTVWLRRRDASTPELEPLVLATLSLAVERVRAPARAGRDAATAFCDALVRGELRTGDAVTEAAAEVGLAPASGTAVLLARVHPHVAESEGWRVRALEAAERGSRAVVPGAMAGLLTHAAGPVEILVVLPGPDAAADRAADEALRALGSALPGHGFAVGHSRGVGEPGELPRAATEALLACNVAEGDPERPLLGFEDTGAYRLLLSAMAEDPQELQRFYAETVEPLAAYDHQYETDLVGTVAAYLDADGSVAAAAQRLFTHRHTVRYRLERVKELCGLDVTSSDGRERLSLGLKAMRVLGIGPGGGRAAEPRERTGGRARSRNRPR